MRRIRSSSTQPPDTDPSPRIASIAPAGRGEDPQVSTMVARITRCPSLSHETLLRKTCKSTLSINVHLSYRSARTGTTILIQAGSPKPIKNPSAHYRRGVGYNAGRPAENDRTYTSGRTLDVFRRERQRTATLAT